jgi:hypothetical protein
MVIKPGLTHNSAKGSDHRFGELPCQSKQVLFFILFFFKKKNYVSVQNKIKRIIKSGFPVKSD